MIYAQLKIDFEFFYKLFMKLLKNISQYLNFNIDPQEYLERKQGLEIFSKEKYIESFENSETKEFVKRMVNTQCFLQFIDKAFKIHHNILSKDEADYEKIEYFFKCLKVCNEKSPNELRKMMNTHFRRALKSFYNNK